jgi:hydroxyethylthiazole kinase-like uncharacterized protein yjeF
VPEPTVVTGQTLLGQWPLPDPDSDTDKDQRGRVVVIGGARSTPGAVLLAGLAALRVGAGKLTIATTDAHATALSVEVPEAGVIGLPTTDAGGISADAADEVAETADGVDAVLFGPGMADPEETKKLLATVLPRLGPDAVLVFDALAATCGVLDSDLGDHAGRAVITPNATEAGYLLDDTAGSDDVLVRRLAGEYGVTAVLNSSVATPDGSSWVVPKGNAGLGTSGSGDVLAGAVAGIAARTTDPLTAAVWGLALHGAAGDRLAARIGKVGFLARELLDELPGCLRGLTR